MLNKAWTRLEKTGDQIFPPLGWETRFFVNTWNFTRVYWTLDLSIFVLLLFFFFFSFSFEYFESIFVFVRAIL